MACVGQNSINQVEECEGMPWNTVTHKKQWKSKQGGRSSINQVEDLKKQWESKQGGRSSINQVEDLKKQWKSKQGGRSCINQVEDLIKEQWNMKGPCFSFSIDSVTYSFEKGRRGDVLIQEQKQNKQRLSIWVSSDSLEFLRCSILDVSSPSAWPGSFSYAHKHFTVLLRKDGGGEFIKISGRSPFHSYIEIFILPVGWKELVKVLDGVLGDVPQYSYLSAVKSEECYGGGKGDALAVKPEECDIDKDTELSPFSKAIVQSFKRPFRPFEDTDVDSSDGEVDDESDNGSVVALSDLSAWGDTLTEALAEVEEFRNTKEEQEKKKKKEEEEKKRKESMPLRSYLLGKPVRSVYKVYVDACFKRNRKPRFGILVKDPSGTYQFSFVGESKSKRVPQLQTHLEGMLKGTELVMEYINEKPPPPHGKLRIIICSNKSYPVDFVWSPGSRQPPLKADHFTMDVRKILKDLIVYTLKFDLQTSWIPYFDNIAADYLARSPTSKLNKRIPKDEFDEGLKDVIKQVESYEPVNHMV